MPPMSAKPIDPHAPMVEILLLVAELAADGPGRTTSPAGSATSGKSAGSGKAGGVVDLDLAAPTESLKEDLAKLGLRGRWESCRKVQLSIAEGQSASLNLARSQPEITGVTTARFGRSNSIQYQNTGFSVSVQPRVDRSGIVAVEMSVNASRMGGGEEGVPIFVSPEGEKIASRPIHRVVSRSIVRVPKGKSVVVARLDGEERGRRGELVILLSARVAEPKAKGARE
jgi:hypothetical protein